MIRTVFAAAISALVLAAVSNASQAAPIAPLPAGMAAEYGAVTKVHCHWHWHHHHHWRHCW